MDRIKVLRQVFYILGIVCLLGAVLLAVWCIFAPIETLAEKYNEYLVWLSDLELRIASINDKWLVILVIFMLFFVKCALPLYPFSILFVASGMVFRFPAAMTVNILGMILIMTVKYESGVHLGGGNLKRLIRTSKVVTDFIENDGKGNTWVLFLFRLVPFVPINSVSQLYGSMDYDYKKFLAVSMAGYLPQMLSYSIMGRNARNPFSIGFILPIIVMLFLSGISVLILGGVFGFVNKINRKDRKGDIKYVIE